MLPEILVRNKPPSAVPMNELYLPPVLGVFLENAAIGEWHDDSIHQCLAIQWSYPAKY